MLEHVANHNGGPRAAAVPTARHNGPRRFVEVKGPGDQLQPNQKRWLQALEEVGVDASVVDVRWAAGSP